MGAEVISGSANAALAVLAAGQVPGLWRDLDTGDHRGRLVAVGLALGIATTAGVLAKSPWPVLATGAAVFVMLWMDGSPAGAAGGVESGHMKAERIIR